MCPISKDNWTESRDFLDLTYRNLRSLVVRIWFWSFLPTTIYMWQREDIELTIRTWWFPITTRTKDQNDHHYFVENIIDNREILNSDDEKAAFRISKVRRIHKTCIM